AELHGAAWLNAEGIEKLRVEPGLARLGRSLGLAIDCARGVGNAYCTAQRVVRRNRLDRSKLWHAARDDHARKDEGLCRYQPEFARLRLPAVRQRAIPAYHEIGTDELARLERERRPHAVDEEPHACDRRDGHEQGCDQETQ